MSTLSGSGRKAVLGSITRALGPRDRAAADARLAARPRGPQPARAQGTDDERIERFKAEIANASVELINVETIQDVPAAVAELALRHTITGDFRVAPALRDLPWDGVLAQGKLGHNVLFGPADLSVNLGVSRALAGLAETGTLLLTSGPEDPILLAFVAQIHVVVLSRRDMLGGMDDAFDKIRNRGLNPRSVNFITGPSRTGDIEMSLEYGAHGPKKLAVILHD